MDILDAALNKWHEDNFEDVYPTMVLVNDQDFDRDFRISSGMIHFCITKRRSNKHRIRQLFYKNVIIIRTPDIKSGTVKLI